MRIFKSAIKPSRKIKASQESTNALLNGHFSANEMAKIGQFMKKQGDSQHKTGFAVFVTNDNRPLAHIHIEQKDGSRKMVCVEFCNPPKYFAHGSYPDKFSAEESKEFDDFLRLPYKYPQTFSMGVKKFKVTTNWEYTVYQWKLENDGSIDNLLLKTDKDGFVIYPVQPDYTKLNAL